MSDCVFCKIARHEINSSVIYEDQNIIAFMDIMPARKGHLLVIPKRHYQTILDIPADELGRLIKTVQLCAKAVKKGLKVEGFNVLQSNGRIAGQVVDHCHFHVIPRGENDSLRLGWGHEIYEADEINKYAEKITSNL